VQRTEKAVVVESAGALTEPSDRPSATRTVPSALETEHVRVNTLAQESVEVSPELIVLGFPTIIAAGVAEDSDERSSEGSSPFCEEPEPPKSEPSALPSSCPRPLKIPGCLCSMVAGTGILS